MYEPICIFKKVLSVSAHNSSLLLLTIFASFLHLYTCGVQRNNSKNFIWVK
ncbi:hypothetical protein Hesp110 [Hemileuca sp. nucleopolyhedrovirus]|uniref:Uncharacterized protein n=1 Tax=Hemileuca sp. nucleopolyhedrovirus TaxID=1367203 RepID=S5N9D6_9ABAC|nr:hypothetical protein Hesp110 [Hemileuca sp. nucleopolyhedrovirus]AGR56862.1 hypothetical protein Hesp110 [Hemileuca sp. nucleopolyhedrovirus]